MKNDRGTAAVLEPGRRLPTGHLALLEVNWRNGYHVAIQTLLLDGPWLWQKPGLVAASRASLIFSLINLPYFGELS